MQGLRRDLKSVADQVLGYRTIVSRWAARDFKRQNTPDGLTATQYAILDAINSRPDLNTRQLADQLELAPPTVVRAVDALQRKSMIRRHRHDRDGRQIVFSLTRTGDLARKNVADARRERLGLLLKAMTPEEMDALLLGYQGLARATQTVRESQLTTG